VGIERAALAVIASGIGLLSATQTQAAIKVPGYEGELKTQIEFRQDIYDRDSIPFDNYLKLDVRDLKGNSELHFYGKLWKDLGYGTDWNVDIYQLYVEVPFDKRKDNVLTVGRQFISEGFETYIADAVRYQGKTGKVRYVFYVGKPRYFEPNSPSGDDFLGGFRFDYNGLFLGFEHLRHGGHVQKSSVAVGNFKYLTPKISQFSRFEYDVANGKWVSANFGVNLFPSIRTKLTSEFEYYNGSYTYYDNRYENTIFHLFSPQGRELRFTQSAYYQLNRTWQLFGNYSITDLQRNGKDRGHLLKVGLIRDRWFEEGLRAYGALLYQNSWIGILRGFEFGFTKFICPKFTLTGTVDVARYSKITYGKQWATAYYLRGTYQTTDFSNLEFGIDLRQNEDFDRDLRLIVRYNYLFWGGSWRTEKQTEDRK
jgi:hypothetical protein